MLLTELMSALYKGLEAEYSKYGFSPVFPEGIKANEVPAVLREGDAMYIDYTGAKGKLRMLYSENKIFLLAAPVEADSTDDAQYSRISTNLFILDEYDSRDVKSAINELSETLSDNFGKKDVFAKSSQKKPGVVSRAAAKGGASYDSNTLAVKLLGAYPELKEAYNDNIRSYGDFLSEDFFIHHATPVILKTIEENDAQRMKKLFNILNEIYDSGSNDVQNTIAVTILGAVKNEPTKLTNMIPYLGDTMLEPVLEVNKILEKSKSANMRLENPPKYKPKKDKKGGLLAQMMGGGMPQQ